MARFVETKEKMTMSKRSASAPSVPMSVELGENPVNKYQARIYAQESSPSSVAVCLELTENARDNGTVVTLSIDVESYTQKDGINYLVPKRIICEDNGTGLSHSDFLDRFCGAFSDSDVHRDTDRAGRNGVGTKTYTSIADRVLVSTTTARETEGLDEHRNVITANAPIGITIPKDGEPDTVWRSYEFKLHSRSVAPALWSTANAHEMGTRIELVDILDGTEIPFEVLLERLSYSREWLQNSAHSFMLQLLGNVPQGLGASRRITLRPWNPPTKNWLVKAIGTSDEAVTIFDETTGKTETVPATNLEEPLQFDFRVVGRGNDGQMQSLEKPALLLEICGALPYPPNLEGGQSARTLPLLTFLGLEHASSIGAFCNSVCGYARINSLALKNALRNNKSTLASGPGTEQVEALRIYLYDIFKALHRAWYNATRSSQDEAAKEAVSEAEVEVNFALKGANRSPFKGGEITRVPPQDRPTVDPPPLSRHRWECGSCERRWLVDAGIEPEFCAQTTSGGDKGDGCGSENVGLAKNQPRIGDCRIRIEQLGDPKIPASFQFEREGEDMDVPVVRVNQVSPRYIELRGAGRLSGQAQLRLKQFLIDVALTAIAEFNANTKESSFSAELGELYYNRMLRFIGIKQYEAQVSKLLEASLAEQEQKLVLTN
jgi:Histidine kinase-, DNA gyrase B-, and HSP90-like ATPase